MYIEDRKVFCPITDSKDSGFANGDANPAVLHVGIALNNRWSPFSHSGVISRVHLIVWMLAMYSTVRNKC